MIWVVVALLTIIVNSISVFYLGKCYGQKCDKRYKEVMAEEIEKALDVFIKDFNRIHKQETEILLSRNNYLTDVAGNYYEEIKRLNQELANQQADDWWKG